MVASNCLRHKAQVFKTVWFLIPALALSLMFARCVAANEPVARIVFLGDSLTAGYQILEEEAYPALIAEKAKAEGVAVDVINGGMSGDTSAGALRRLPWLLKNKTDILFIAIGANDGLRGLPITELEGNLRQIIKEARRLQPGIAVIVAGIRIPRHVGTAYGAEFEAVYARVAGELRTVFMPFLLEGVAGMAERNLADGIHPSPAGHRVIMENVWPVVAPLLLKPAQRTGS